MSTATKFSHLAPVSKHAMDRLRDLASMAPMSLNDKTSTADEELARAGWITISPVDGDGVTWVDMSSASYTPDGKCVLFNNRGCVHDCWMKSS